PPGWAPAPRAGRRPGTRIPRRIGSAERHRHHPAGERRWPNWRGGRGPGGGPRSRPEAARDGRRRRTHPPPRSTTRCTRPAGRGGLQGDQRPPARPDGAIGELATPLHAPLVGELRIISAAHPLAWRTFLLLLAQSPGEIQGQGGIARLWTGSGGQHVQVREVDY